VWGCMGAEAVDVVGACRERVGWWLMTRRGFPTVRGSATCLFDYLLSILFIQGDLDAPLLTRSMYLIIRA
jgi:hypothetical protein